MTPLALIALAGMLPRQTSWQDVLEGPRRHQSEWVRLFDGKSLEGWIPKVRGYALGDNFGNTFRVENGVIRVSYDGYGGKFAGRFGHLFYKSPYSSYVFRCEYRFTGEQLPDGPGWAYRNSGAMLHCQPPETMGKDQDFPVCLEAQFLGGNGKDERHTGNVCTPGTNMVMNGKLVTQHCTDSTSPTFHGDQWVRFEAEVHGSGRMIHRINGMTVLEYEQPQLDESDPLGKALIKNGQKLIESGYISLQSESHPVEFRNIELKVLPR